MCQKFISYRRVQSKGAVLQEVMLIDSYSCLCPMLVMLLCMCCEWFDLYDFMPFVCVRAAFAFVFVNTSEKANNAKVIGYYVLYRLTDIKILPASTLRKIIIITASLVSDCFWPLPLIVED